MTELESQSRISSLKIILVDRDEPPVPIKEERPEAEGGSNKTISKEHKMEEEEEEKDAMWARRILESEFGSGYMEKLI